MRRETWDIYDADKEKGEKQTGDGHCFHWNRTLGFCKCLKFEVKKEA